MKIIVFSDLDGTLLDHETYTFAPANDALNALKAAGIPLVLASSKTAAEMAHIHAAMGLGDTPGIVENGSGFYDPRQPLGQGAESYTAIRKALHALPQVIRKNYRGFGDMTAAEIADITGLPANDAKAAAARQFSEPGLWTGNDDEKSTFLKLLSEKGIAARDGGRFLTLSHGRTKADAMEEVTSQLEGDVTIALGDAPNDREMLEQADYAVIVRNDHGPDVNLSKPNARVIKTELPGPAGWNAAVLALLKDLQKNN